MSSVTSLARKLKPYSSQSVVASGPLTPHDLDGVFHTGVLADNQAPQFLLLTGGRPMVGGLDMGLQNITNVGLINGIDITEIAANASGQINAGVGINISDNGVIASTPTISVDVPSLIGPGLAIAGFNDQIQVKGGTGIKIDATNGVELASSAAGAGLGFSGGVLSVNAGTGISTAQDSVSVDLPGLAGDGLGGDTSSLFVNIGANLKLSSDSVAVDVPTLAGTGLTASGTTLQIATGDGIQLVSDAIAVKASDLVGQGLRAVSNNLEIRIGNGLAFNGNEVVVDESADFDWTGIHTHAGNVASFGAISGTSGWTLFPNGNADFRDIQADSLTVDAFIADVNLALAGSEYITKSGGTLSRDFTIPSTSGFLYVFDLIPDTQNFEAGDTLALRYIDRGTGLTVGWAWGTVAGYADLDDGEQRWTFTRTSGLAGYTIRAGMWAIDYGVPGDGIIKSTVNDLESPFIDIQTWASDAYTSTNFTTHLRLGRLSGITDTKLQPGGYGLYSDNAYLRGELVLDDGNVVLDGGGLSLNGTNNAASLVDTAEKITWYTDNDDRAQHKAIGFIQGLRKTGASDSNEVELFVGSGYAGSGHTGSDTSKIRLYSWYIPTPGLTSSAHSSSITLEGEQDSAEISISSRTILLNNNFAGSVQVGNGPLRPTTWRGSDLGTSSYPWDKIYANELIVGTTSTTDTGHNHDDRYYLESEVDSLLAGKSGTSHTHSGYATVSYVDTEVGAKADDDHDHSEYLTLAAFTPLFNQKANLSHAHNNLYYTQTEIDNLLLGKEDTGHTHPGAGGGASTHSELAGVGENDHHNRSHSLDSATDHTGTLSWSKVSKTGANLTDLGGQLPWASIDTAGADLSGLIGPISWAGIDFTSSDIDDIGGTLAWANLSKSGSSLSDLATRSHGQLTSIGADDHHAKLHALDDAAHHSGTLADNQAPQFLLLDGSRSMTGHLRNDGGFDNDIGSEIAPWRNLHVLNLQATQLVPTDTMATLDGRILVSESAKLTRDVSSADVTIYLDSAAFESDDYAYLQTISSGTPQFEAIRFVSGPTTITTNVEYSYTVARYEDEPINNTVVSTMRKAGLNSALFPDTGFETSVFVSGGKSWIVGDGVVSLGGSVGDGLIDITSGDSILGNPGPTINIFSRSSTTDWSDIDNVVALGNLQGRLDYTAPSFGLAIGDNLNSQIETFRGLTADGDDGIRLFNTPISQYYNASGAQKLGAFFGSDTGGIPLLKISSDVDGLFFSGGTFGTGWSGEGLAVLQSISQGSGTTLFIGDSAANQYLTANSLGVNVVGTLGAGGMVFDGISKTSFVLTGGKTSYTTTSGESLDLYKETIGAADYLTLAADTTTGSGATGIKLKSTVDTEDEIGIKVDQSGSTFVGNVRIENPDTATADTLYMTRGHGLHEINIGDGILIGSPTAFGREYNEIYTYPLNGGTGGGSRIGLARNNNLSTPASGYLSIENLTGDTYYMWVDADGDLRYGDSVPSNANDATGQGVASYGGWINLNYTAGWEDYDATWVSGQYRKVGDRIEIRGLCKRTSGTSLVVATLPPEARPEKYLIQVVIQASNTAARMTINPNGDILLADATSNFTYLSLQMSFAL